MRPLSQERIVVAVGVSGKFALASDGAIALDRRWRSQEFALKQQVGANHERARVHQAFRIGSQQAIVPKKAGFSLLADPNYRPVVPILWMQRNERCLLASRF